MTLALIVLLVIVVAAIGAYLASRNVAGQVEDKLEPRPSPDALRHDADQPVQ